MNVRGKWDGVGDNKTQCRWGSVGGHVEGGIMWGV